jgi:hypothetical protein
MFTSYINHIISGSLEIYRPLAAIAVQSNLPMLNQLIVIMLLMMTLSLSLYILHSSQLLIMVHHRTGGFKVPTHASQALVTTSPPGQRCCYCTEDRKVESLKPPPVHTQRLQAVPFPILQ